MGEFQTPVAADLREKTTHQFGNYQIESMIGKGGMAEVYRATVLTGPLAGRSVAIKRLTPEMAKDPNYLDQFSSEAGLSLVLDHANIVKVYETGVIQGTYYIAMELVDGCDLAHLLRRLKRRGVQVPIDFAVYLVKVLLDALAYAHSARTLTGKSLGVVHCDVSPSNLFVSRTGEIKLGDFGIADSAALGPLIRQRAGKVYYLSPELIAGEVTPAVDLWAAAVTLYELLTLERPFTGATPQEVLTAIRGGKFTPAEERRTDVSAGLAEILRRGLARSAAARFGSASEFASALQPQYDEGVGTPLAIAGMVRGLFGAIDLL